MHEDNSPSSWRDDVEGIEERRKDRKEKASDEESRSGKRKVEREGGENGFCEEKVCQPVFQ